MTRGSPIHPAHAALLPRPRSAVREEGALALVGPFVPRDAPAGVDALAALARACERRGLPPAPQGGPPLFFARDRALPSEGYRLRLGPLGATIDAADERGWLWGAATLAQLVLAAPEGARGPELPACTIEDAPELARRGVMLDVSRDRVPTVATLERIVRLLAGWKLNELQLYTEHTFAYAGHEEVWRGSDPLTPDELRRLDRFAHRHGVELVPNQQCFGHLHRWLRLPRYRPLAECPAGVRHPFSDAVEPFSLCPGDPGALALVEELLDQLLPCFTSPELHVGLDETFDLGQGRSRAACEALGVGRVHADWLRRLHHLARARGRRTWYWADVALRHPEALELLPRDAVACPWGYEAGHDFDGELGRLSALGLPTVACPGTSTWKSFAGRPANMAANVTAAAAAARRHGALGLLVTDWGDLGHLQPLAASYPGWAAAAARAWRGDPEPPGPEELGPPVDRDAFDGLAGATALLWRLGRAGEEAGALPNGTLPFQALVCPDAFPPPGAEPAREALEGARAEAEAALGELASLGAGDPHVEELAWAGRAVALGARLALARREAPGAPLEALSARARAPLAAELAELAEQHAPLWTRRSRPGGAADSRRRLERVLARLRA